MARTNNVTVTDKYDFRCRNKGVLLRIVDKGKLHGIAMPEIAIQGKEFYVVAKGPKVEDLQVGDQVMPRGTRDVDYCELPFARDLIYLEEENVVLVITPAVQEDA